MHQSSRRNYSYHKSVLSIQCGKYAHFLDEMDSLCVVVLVG